MYDKEKIYDEKISPLITEIIKICTENGINMIMDFYLKQETVDEDNMHCTTCINTGYNKNERITDLYNVAMNGYTVQKPFFMSMMVTKENQP